MLVLGHGQQVAEVPEVHGPDFLNNR
jgi:hypothetical protein